MIARGLAENMSSIVLDLQSEAMSHEGSVLVLLRKTLAIARKLSIRDMQSWAQAEIGGYAQNKALPDYRQFVSQVKYCNIVHGWQPLEFQGATREISQRIQQVVSELNFSHPMAEIEAMMNSEDGDVIQVPIPMEKMAAVFGYREAQVSQFIAKQSLHRIPDAVRTHILNWSLDLEERNIWGNGMSFTPQEQARAITIIYNAPQYQNNGQVGAMGERAAVRKFGFKQWVSKILGRS